MNSYVCSLLKELKSTKHHTKLQSKDNEKNTNVEDKK